MSVLHFWLRSLCGLSIVVNIILLTHPREVLRANNTGQLVTKVLGERVRVVEWHRKQPDAALLSAIEAGKVGLVFPSADTLANVEVPSRVDQPLHQPSYEYLVIIDATWQEARKMFNQSPYLKALAKVSLVGTSKSIYPLRRNQIEGGLCTAECVIHILTESKNLTEAHQLSQLLMTFIGANP
ncbi:DTW domain-containing protein [Shewanella psychromarinicola]|uniref:tRNA-uridine aminocarboxypropyltransferase n=1 Tax=Shewanella psychromarinicola TaxID=2487742 RepID=A0A3N4E9I0_9GAMM|nr:DTW domain-containing protein [Shewanella psychromarinicola]RPA34743.1 DTW domain-containing protein [Shewanella psychromarinicola]